MRALLDTNVLVYSANSADPLHESVDRRILRLIDDGWELCVAPQCLYEFWVAVTKPGAARGLGLDPESAARALQRNAGAFLLLLEPPDLWTRWLQTCLHYRVAGRGAHDARLVAWMGSHDITTIVTVNANDFRRYDDIDVIDPRAD